MIQINNIQKSYGKKQVLKDITFTVKPGERVAIIGRNGCGKSTLMEILSGMIKPDAGSVCYFGQEPLKKKKVFRQLCGYVPQENPLMEELSVWDNLKLFGATKDTINSPLLEKLDIDKIKEVRVSDLSGGMKRRVSIAAAVLHHPAILFMDEPTTALDIYYKACIHQWMDAYRKMNGIIVITSHDMAEILSCERCFLMRDGVLRELTKEEITEENIQNERERLWK